MTRSLRVATIIGTRPEIIRLSRVIPTLDEHFEHTLVHTGQNFSHELNEALFADLDLRRPDVSLACAAATPAATCARVIEKSDEFFTANPQDALLVLGDTNSSLAAYAAKRRKIAVFHMEAGNRCFDERVPEEINRRLVDHISDVNLPYSDIAREHLVREGFPADRIVKTGSPLREVLAWNRARIDANDVLQRHQLKEREYFLVSIHREENVDSNATLNRCVRLLDALADEFDMPVVVSTHPRTKKRLDEINVRLNKRVRFQPPFPFTDYAKLQLGARCVLSDSGTISEESDILGFPAVNLRETQERPEAVEEGVVAFSGLDWPSVRTCLGIALARRVTHWPDPPSVRDYRPTGVSHTVAAAIASYTAYVRRTVWSDGTAARPE